MDEFLGDIIFIIFCTSFIWGVVCQIVGNSKNINGFLWGFFLRWIGLIVVFCLPKKDNPSTINLTNNNCTNISSQLENLVKLKESGAITNEEFNNEKKELLK